MKKAVLKELVWALSCILLLFSGCGMNKTEQNPEEKTGSTECMETQEKGAEESITITVQTVAFLDYYTKCAMERYETEHPGVKFELLEPIEWGTKDVGYARIYSEITGGKGPDLIIGEREDLLAFADKDCLMDLSDAVSEETKKALIASVQESGSINGKMVLIPGNLNVSMLITQASFGAGDSWTIADVVEIIEKREKEGKPFEWIAVTGGQPCEAVDVFDFFARCLDESDFINWESRCCFLTDPLFVKVLEISKKYNEYANSHKPDARSYTEELSLLKEGRVLAVYDQVTRLTSYSEMRNSLGNGYRTVGFPCDQGNGRRAVYATNMAVNRNTVNGRVIKEFIDFYYSLDVCAMNNCEIRKDLYEGRIIYDDSMKMYGITADSSDGRGIVLLAVREDGSDYAEEYFQLLDSFHGAQPNHYREWTQIQEILYEESDRFFAGEGDAQETAERIQNRVELLLAE